MKPRHAVALALVGWYLMMPPQTRTWWIGDEYYDDSAPLNRWTIERSFDKAEACQALGSVLSNKREMRLAA